MTRYQLRRLFLRHRGEMAALHRRLGVKPATISKWFRSQTNSARIEKAVRERAAELLSANPKSTEQEESEALCA